jgi:two-component system, LytTR family, response regulator
MLRVVIIDDEANSVALISGALKIHCRNVNVVATANNVATGLATIQAFNPDIVLLDIKMPDGTGLDLLRQIDEINFKVIFITAYQEFAIQAFKFSALDYLLKPFDTNELVAAITKAEESIHSKNIRLNLGAFYENLNHKLMEPKKIVLKTADHIYAVSIKDIIRCESEGNYTIFILNDGRKLMVSKILKEYDDLLSGYNFFRVHQSHLINMHYFESYKKTDGGSVIMTDKSSIPVAYRKKDDFLRLLASL